MWIGKVWSDYGPETDIEPAHLDNLVSMDKLGSRAYFYAVKL